MRLSRTGLQYESRHVFSAAADDDEPNIGKEAEKALLAARAAATEASRDPANAGIGRDELLRRALSEHFRRDPKLSAAWKSAPGTTRG